MAGTPVLAAFVAFWGFWVLLLTGWFRDELGVTGTSVFLLLWLIGLIGLRTVLSGLLFTPYLALLDIALVFVVFKGDIRLT